MKNPNVWFAALLVMVAFAACSHSGPTSVESITIMNDDGNGKPGSAVESIKSTDHRFHAKISLDVGVDKKITTELVAVDTPDGKNVSVLTKEYELGGIENTITMDYSLPNDWPVGTYKVNVSSGGKLLMAKEFQIQ